MYLDDVESKLLIQVGQYQGSSLFKIQADILIEHLFTQLRCPCLTHTLLKAALRKWKEREKNLHWGKGKKGSEAAGHDVSSCSGWLSPERANRYSEVRRTHCRNVVLTTFFFSPANSTFLFLRLYVLGFVWT